MYSINVALRAKGHKGNLEPCDIFGFAGGTSTGGLIAIMLTRLRMSIEECIQEYRELSKVIFKKKRIRGKLSGGLYRARYHGSTLRNCVRGLLDRRGLRQDELLAWQADESDTQKKMHW